MIHLSPRKRRQSAQAMTEYVVIAALLTAALVTPIPGLLGPDGKDHNFASLMLEAYRTNYTSNYYLLNLPFP